ncbi:hypothetical protein [Methanoculleus chikugoensis]|uniref:hypothetical protein n=1 Tax=Methanoculleus chikugoensis TaxID=118126 RepID=UPI001FB3B3E3|nr:hypothetical protein [Methanoculleus chikugoensis]
MDPDSPEPSGGLKIPKLPDLKIPKLAVDRRKALTAAGGVAVAAIAVLLIGGGARYELHRRPAGFGIRKPRRGVGG